jgi:hypothetical protein
MRTTRSAHLIPFDLINLTVFGKEYNLTLLIIQFSLSSCYFLPPRSRFCTQHLTLKSPQFQSPLWRETKVQTHTKQQKLLISILIYLDKAE